MIAHSSTWWPRLIHLLCDDHPPTCLMTKAHWSQTLIIIPPGSLGSTLRSLKELGLFDAKMTFEKHLHSSFHLKYKSGHRYYKHCNVHCFVAITHLLADDGQPACWTIVTINHSPGFSPVPTNLLGEGVPYGFTTPPATIRAVGTTKGERLLKVWIVEWVGDDTMWLRVQTLRYRSSYLFLFAEKLP